MSFQIGFIVRFVGTFGALMKSTMYTPLLMFFECVHCIVGSPTFSTLECLVRVFGRYVLSQVLLTSIFFSAVGAFVHFHLEHWKRLTWYFINTGEKQWDMLGMTYIKVLHFVTLKEPSSHSFVVTQVALISVVVVMATLMFQKATWALEAFRAYMTHYKNIFYIKWF